MTVMLATAAVAELSKTARPALAGWHATARLCVIMVVFTGCIAAYIAADRKIQRAQ
jgi:hypothetical protein